MTRLPASSLVGAVLSENTHLLTELGVKGVERVPLDRPRALLGHVEMGSHLRDLLGFPAEPKVPADDLALTGR